MVRFNNSGKDKQSQRGAAMVEAALVMPVVLLLIAAFVGYGLVLSKLQVLQMAARDAARIASFHPQLTQANFDDSAGNDLVETDIKPFILPNVEEGAHLASPSLEVSYINASATARAKVSVTVSGVINYSFFSMLGFSNATLSRTWVVDV